MYDSRINANRNSLGVKNEGATMRRPEIIRSILMRRCRMKTKLNNGLLTVLLVLGLLLSGVPILAQDSAPLASDAVSYTHLTLPTTPYV